MGETGNIEQQAPAFVVHRRRAVADGVSLSRFSDEGRTATNVLLLRRAEARAVLGLSSLLVLWVWKIDREGEAQPFGQDFFASLRPKPPLPR